ncbi:MAG: peptidyl-prolyl cis-trans isomerase [Burkholderiales bacterium]|jgi:peptidyl-prolyl cis-trans isomerase C
MSFTRSCARAAVGAALALSLTAAWAQNAAIVNNKPIPKQKLDEFVAALAAQGRPDSPELRAAVREELIAREIFAQEAERRGLLRNADVQRQLETSRQEILIRAVIREHIKANPITDADIKAEYEKAVKGQADKEYRARHILVEKEDAAKQIIADLKKGAKFEDLVKQSKDTGSANNGGDLDWNVASTFVKPFADAMSKLEKGKFTETPVQTQFGWHVIRLDDVREAKAPPIEQVKPQIQQELERRRIQDLQKDLRAKAKIQ